MKAGAQSTQVGGDHYLKRPIQPWDIWEAYPEMDPFTASIIKYMLRWPDKNGLTDLRKARHTLNKLIEMEEAKIESTIEDALSSPVPGPFEQAVRRIIERRRDGGGS